jgi:uridylate kinase
MALFLECHFIKKGVLIMAIYKRIVLKISGESLAGDKANGSILDISILNDYAKVIKELVNEGVQVSIVVGAGNIWRGKIAENMGMDRATGDYMGMLGTIMNALAIQNILEQNDVKTRVMTSLPINAVAEPYIRRKAITHLEKGYVVIFGGGTGNPFFSTDTAAALRASEIGAEVILMAKNGVAGVYSADPKVNKDAILYSQITYIDVIQQQLKVMDTTAVSLCMDNNIDIVVFNMSDTNNLIRVINGEKIGTTIRKEF